VSALEGNAIEITSANISGLTLLCEEFGFEELRAKLASSLPRQEQQRKTQKHGRESQRWKKRQSSKAA
jgi:hypothetical protein